jgi:hypothetical protein
MHKIKTIVCACMLFKVAVGFKAASRVAKSSAQRRTAGQQLRHISSMTHCERQQSKERDNTQR